MDYKTNINKMKSVQNIFLEYYDNELTSESEYQISNFNYFDDLQNEEKKDRLIDISNLICQITADHHRLPNFYNKTEKIISLFKNSIEKFLSNDELFKIFESNKLILLCLLNNKILKIDEKIAKSLSKYSNYFFYEISQFYSNNSINLKDSNSQLEEYNKKRFIGENDNYICQLIREDSITEFISYINKTNTSLSSHIEQSTFETNNFLLNEKATLIEYAAFYGSIQIFNYLRLNNIELKSSLWLYAIHSKNADIIHLLEENHVPSSYYEEDDFYFELTESIKCHHNDIANYILNTKTINQSYIISYVEYYNYEMFDEKVSKLLYKFVEYNYLSIVKIFLNNPGVDAYDNDILIIILSNSSLRLSYHFFFFFFFFL